MTAITYSGPEPIAGLWVLDDGFELKSFMAAYTLAYAFLDGAGIVLPQSMRYRPASLQWFGADGYCDASSFIGTPPPSGLADAPTSQEAYDARIKFNRGDAAEWLALRKEGDRQRLTYRQELAAKLDAFRAAHLRAAAVSDSSSPR